MSAINPLVFQTKSTFPDLTLPKRVKLE
ncbi:MAG: vacuolar H+transporting two-sector ATPase F subunit, partial [Nitrosopumilus sp.]